MVVAFGTVKRNANIEPGIIKKYLYRISVGWKSGGYQDTHILCILVHKSCVIVKLFTVKVGDVHWIIGFFSSTFVAGNRGAFGYRPRKNAAMGIRVMLS